MSPGRRRSGHFHGGNPGPDPADEHPAIVFNAARQTLTRGLQPDPTDWPLPKILKGRESDPRSTRLFGRPWRATLAVSRPLAA